MTTMDAARAAVAPEADAAVAAAGHAASAGAGPLRTMPADGLDKALRGIATRLAKRADVVIGANADDVRTAKADGLRRGVRGPADARCGPR